MTEKTWTVQQVIAWIVDDLKKRGIESARIDADLIVAHALGIDRVQVLINNTRVCTHEELETIRELVKRRRSWEPIAYLRHVREFYGLPFYVDSRVLIPRPETEILVETALRLLKHHELAARVLDLCTGSGCVAVAMKHTIPTLSIDAVDLSKEALAVAKHNAHRLGALWKTRFLQGDLFEALHGMHYAGPYDLITANPPYIASGEIPTLAADVRDHEPHLAFDGGPQGLSLVERIINEAPKWLRAGGALAIEIGWGQSERVKEMFKQANFTQVTVARDYANIDRVVSGILNASFAVD